ncbi:hypothetical protein AC1031_019592 [Aphanomyces cochlioides]|nr:hypothetical protein AC1031_019592 [Aphanomyces cochlioides]
MPSSSLNLEPKCRFSRFMCRYIRFSSIVNDVGPARDGGVRPADQVVNEIRAKGGVAVANYDSVTDGAKVVATAIEAFGRVDIIVNNAGILRDRAFHKMTRAEWDAVKSVHLDGTFAVTHAAWPYMRQQKYGRIVNITSVNGLYGQAGQANYSSVKAGMIGFTKALAKEGSRSNIKVNVVAPGAGSSMTATVLPENVHTSHCIACNRFCVDCQELEARVRRSYDCLLVPRKRSLHWCRL